MIELRNEPISKYVTIRSGGLCQKILIPESENELINCVQSESKYYLLGGGSNIIPTDNFIKTAVIWNNVACKNIDCFNDRVLVGSSVRLQYFVKYLVENNFLGYEYLISVPGTVGGGLFL